MDKIKILVAQHKEAEVFHNDVYIPIQVGKAISKVDLGILGDDTGDNISELNPYFCELTAQYWAWKNMHDVEYIGLCHYRRYFKTEFTAENVEQIMGNADIVLVKPVYNSINILESASNELLPENLTTFYLYLKKCMDERAVEKFFIRNNKFNPCNMFVCKKELFDKFCKWQFGILLPLFDILPRLPFARACRLMGYLGEMMLPFYCKVNHLRVREMPIVANMHDHKVIKYGSLMTNIKLNVRFWLFFSKRRYKERQDVITGLSANGIIDKISKL